MKDWLRILKATDAAARWHANQRRKGAAAEPYVNHLIEVAMLVAEATDGNDPDLVIAALLHDAIEDCNVSKETIADAFGADIASVVMEVTDDKRLPKAERKQKQIEMAPFKSQRAKILKLADKISNLRAIADSPPADWSLERRLDYIQWARKVAAGLQGASQKLATQFDEVAATAQGSANPAA